MITFQCSRCNTEFNVEDSEAGKRSKCTRCGNIMRIPEKSYRTLQIYDYGGIFQNKELDSLYNAFLDNYEEIVIQHRVLEGTSGSAIVIMEIATQHFRTQLIHIVMLEVDGDPKVLISSVVGQVEYASQALAALRAIHLGYGVALSVSDDNLLNIGIMGRLEWYTDADFASAILDVANFADVLEDSIFGGDAR